MFITIIFPRHLEPRACWVNIQQTKVSLSLIFLLCKLDMKRPWSRNTYPLRQRVRNEWNLDIIKCRQLKTERTSKKERRNCNRNIALEESSAVVWLKLGFTDTKPRPYLTPIQKTVNSTFMNTDSNMGSTGGGHNASIWLDAKPKQRTKRKAVKWLAPFAKMQNGAFIRFCFKKDCSMRYCVVGREGRERTGLKPGLTEHMFWHFK